jgi:DNA (cytosine-5)-methyltransferase 1
MTDQKPKVVSMFTGAGGMDEGFKAAGFNVVACMDIEQWACDTLRINNPEQVIIGPPFHSGDIKKIGPEEFSRITNIPPGEIDVLVGGPPCQPFSQAASQRFLKGDHRFKRLGFSDELKGTLLAEFISYIKYFKPKSFVLENVPGLLSIDGGERLNACLEELKEIGYAFTAPKKVNAVDYGVPQFRERLIIWGTNVPNIRPTVPLPTHGGDLLTKPYRVVANVLSDVPTDCVNHVTRSHKPESILRYKKLLFGEREKLGRVDRLDPLRPSKTVIAGGMSGGGRSHLHPYIARTLSVRECARIQTFTDDFKFVGSIARQFTQVGNAVPPLLAEHFARQIMTEVFSKPVPTKLRHEKHCTDLPGVTLGKLVFENALKEKPEWIYDSHSNSKEKPPVARSKEESFSMMHQI